MKFITPRTSETGKKLALVEQKVKDAHKACIALAEEIGFEQWRQEYLVVAGGISAVQFPKGTNVDTTIWKNENKSKTEWSPRLTSKEGKALQARFNALPVVRANELNDCIDWDAPFMKNIGVAFGNTEYFGITVREEWEVKMPTDCEEVTISKYKELFP